MRNHGLMIALLTGCLMSGVSSVYAGQAQPSQQDNKLVEKTGKPPAAQSGSSGGSVVQALGTTLADLPEFGNNFSSFMLDNGMQVVVIPDHRAPVVTHMVWYKVGAADEKLGQSGIAHFLEHLMFKGTKSHPDGEFSKIVASIGGEENAFTSYDYTAYFQRVAKQHLKMMMELEADRMSNLELRDDQVKTELQVILEERASRIDNDPGAQLSEALSAAIYRNHPYGIPVIGWEHEMEQLNRQTAIDFYNLYYTPNNAILVVAGDVTEEEVKSLAQTTYGKVARRAEPEARIRPQEPPQRTARTVTMRHERVTQPSVRRAYMTPSDLTAAPGESEALDLLAYILGSGTNSRLYQNLVVNQKIATSAGAYYQSGGIDDTTMMFYGQPAQGKTVDDVLDGIKLEISKVIKDGVSDEDVARAKRSLLAQTFYAQDNQASLARIVGTNLSTGYGLDKIKSWPERLAKVTADQIVDVAQKYLQEHRSVTGYLLPPAAANDNEAAATSSDAPNGADQIATPQAREMSQPKSAPRDSQKVPAPKSRPQGHPKPKPAEDQPADQQPQNGSQNSNG